MEAEEEEEGPFRKLKSGQLRKGILEPDRRDGKLGSKGRSARKNRQQKAREGGQDWPCCLC